MGSACLSSMMSAGAGTAIWLLYSHVWWLSWKDSGTWGCKRSPGVLCQGLAVGWVRFSSVVSGPFSLPKGFAMWSQHVVSPAGTWTPYMAVQAPKSFKAEASKLSVGLSSGEVTPQRPGYLGVVLGSPKGSTTEDTQVDFII